MKFRHRNHADPEINLIPFIDVLLVIIIFLMLTTSYSQVSALHIRLPNANSQQQNAFPETIEVIVTSDGSFAIDGALVRGPSVSHLSQLLAQAASQRHEAVIVINADGNAAHQSVVTVMDAARLAGLTRLTFATRSSTESN